MIEKFGRSMLLLVFVLMFIIGAKMAIKAGSPYIRKLSPSLADSLASV